MSNHLALSVCFHHQDIGVDRNSPTDGGAIPVLQEVEKKLAPDSYRWVEVKLAYVFKSTFVTCKHHTKILVITLAGKKYLNPNSKIAKISKFVFC